MKTTLTYVYALLSCLVLSGLDLGCTPSTADEPTSQATCRIQRVVGTVKNADRQGTLETKYDYDEAGNLLQKTQTNQFQYQTAGSETTTITEQYTYDANKFLIRSTASTSQKLLFANNVSTYQLTSAKEYSYTDNRLSAYTQTDILDQTKAVGGPQSSTTVTTAAYAYDAAGQLTQQTFNNGLVITYQQGKATAFTGSFAYTLEDGLVTKAIFPGTNATGAPRTLVQLRQYDDQRRLSKHQEFVNDTLERYHTQTWQSGKSAEQTLPAFKGHPDIRPAYGESGLMTNYTEYFSNHQQGETTYPYLETKTVYQVNTQGLVTGSTATTTYSTNGQSQPDVTTMTYTYQGCN